jgi:anti-sigma regulatory factor (Ser/Thr protein kinase)
MTQFQVPGGAQAPLSARARLSEAIGSHVDAPVADDVRLLVSELVTNCVVHGGAPDTAPITVRTVVSGDGVRAEVCHQGPGFEPPQGDPDLAVPGGLGLYLVEQMSSRWGITHDRETCVWFELAAARAA